jgi:FMN phosphatase YigB (HAD superfamily)
MKYKAVVFDLFGTLVSNAEPLEHERCLRKVAFDFSMPPDDFVTLWNKAFNAPMAGFLQTHLDCIQYIYRELRIPEPGNILELASRNRFEMTKLEIESPRDSPEPEERFGIG